MTAARLLQPTTPALPMKPSRRSFLKTSAAVAAAAPAAALLRTQAADPAGPLFAYVGTFSSPLKDTLPTQVDLPPGNGRGIHIFKVDRETGALAAAGVHESGVSPSCLAINTAGTVLYAANETDRTGADKKEGSVSAFQINPSDGSLRLL